MDNMRPYGDDSKHIQMGTRPGLAPLFLRGIGGGAPVQAIGSVTRSSGVSGYEVGSCEPIEGESIDAVGLEGHAWLFNGGNAMVREFFCDATALFNPASGQDSAIDCAIHETLERIAVVVNISDSNSASGNIETCLWVFDFEGNVLATWPIYDSTEDRFSNSVEFSDKYLFLTSNEAVHVYDAETPTTKRGAYDCQGWSQEATSMAVHKDSTGQEYLFVAFLGSSVGTTLPSAVVVDSGIYASHWRSGVMKFKIRNDTPATPLLMEIFGVQLPASAAYYEDNGLGATHGYFRISEQSFVKPFGCYITGIDVDPAGNLYISRTNQGYGPNSTFDPASLVLPYVTVMKVAPTGAVVWEADTNSIRTGSLGNNDIDNPSIKSIAVDSDGDVYVGGRVTAGGQCAFKLDGGAGGILWGAALESGSKAIRDNGIAVDPKDKFPVFFGDRDNAWSGGANAHGWKCNKQSGAIVTTWDLGASVSGLGVDFGGGFMVYSTDYVS